MNNEIFNRIKKMAKAIKYGEFGIFRDLKNDLLVNLEKYDKERHSYEDEREGFINVYGISEVRGLIVSNDVSVMADAIEYVTGNRFDKNLIQEHLDYGIEGF